MEWWQLKIVDLNDEQKKAMRLAYYNTYYGSEHGRQVLLSLQMMYLEEGISPETKLARIDLIDHIKVVCGWNVNVQMAAIEAEGAAIEWK